MMRLAGVLLVGLLSASQLAAQAPATSGDSAAAPMLHVLAIMPQQTVPQINALADSIGHYLPRNSQVTILTGASAAWTSVFDAVQRLKRRARSGDVVLLYYAGGIAIAPGDAGAREPYLVLSSDTTDSRLTSHLLTTWLHVIPAHNQLVVLDASAAGVFLRSVQQLEARSAGVSLRVQDNVTLVAGVAPGSMGQRLHTVVLEALRADAGARQARAIAAAITAGDRQRVYSRGSDFSINPLDPPVVAATAVDAPRPLFLAALSAALAIVLIALLTRFRRQQRAPPPAMADEVSGRDLDAGPPATTTPAPAVATAARRTLVLAGAVGVTLVLVIVLLVRHRGGGTAIATDKTLVLVDSMRYQAVRLYGRLSQADIRAVYVNDSLTTVNDGGRSFHVDLPAHEAADSVVLRIESGQQTFRQVVSLDRFSLNGGDRGFDDQDSSAQAVLERSGRDVAVLIATNQYQGSGWNQLYNPVFDAEAIGRRLRDTYGFEVHLIRDPTQQQIKDTLYHFAFERNYTPDAQLFVFVAGHGIYDEKSTEGYVVATDSKGRVEDPRFHTYVPFHFLRDQLERARSKHVLVVLDVCYGGTFIESIESAQLLRSGDDIYDDANPAQFVSSKLSRVTRRYLTSGGKTRVPDGRRGEHSPFASRLLDAFDTKGGPDRILTLAEVQAAVEKAKPEPRAGAFGNNDFDSDFLFIAQPVR
jgi:hypothetical protein